MMDAGGGRVRSQGVNPDCPNAANPFHRCSDYCPVPAPAASAAAAAASVRRKPSPPRPTTTAVAQAAVRRKPSPTRPTTTAVAQNGTTKHGDGAARVVPAADAEEEEDGGEREEESRAVNPGYQANLESPPAAASAAAVRGKPSPPRPRTTMVALNGTAKHGDGAVRVVPAADAEDDGGEREEESRAVNPGYLASKVSPPRQHPAPGPGPGPTHAAQNGTAKHGDGAARVVPAADAEEEEDGGEREEESRAVNPGYPASKESPPHQHPAPTHAAQNGTARRVEEECEITVVDDSEEQGESVENYGGEAEEEVSGGRTRTSARSPATGGEARRERQWQAVNPDCPNATNPFHRCAEYCPVPVPKVPPPTRGYEGSTHSDPGAPHPRPRRREKGGSGGLPFYVFLREGSDGDGKKVDPRCPNAPNPFHVCTDHCLTKIADAGRSSEGAKSPLSLFSRHSRRSSSSSEEGSLKSPGTRKVNPKCPNAGNPFHECGEHCAGKMQQTEQYKGVNINSPRRKGGKSAPVIPNWKVDPRCPNASNPFHMCAQYCFDHLETAQTSATKSDKRRGKAITTDEQRGEINPDCVNASNPYHKCGDHCKRKGDR